MELNMDLISRVIIPVSTFIIGILVTLGFQRYERKRTVLRQHAQEVLNLINAWYNQLHEIRVELRKYPSISEVEDHIYSYVYSRVILPKLLLSLEVLKAHQEANTLVKEVEFFLHDVTDYRSEIGWHATACRPLHELARFNFTRYVMPEYKEATWRLALENIENMKHESNYKEYILLGLGDFLKRVDQRQQRISREVAEILK